LPYAKVPEFIGSLRGTDASETAKLAFEFLILTATRTGEVLGAKWREVDFEQKIWTITRERMKSARQHVVPLAERCLDILARAKALSGSGEYIFPGRSADKPLSNMVFLMTLRRMRLNITVHGFRSSFRDWASERTNFAREVCEHALAHAVADKTEAAYRRGDLLDKRRDLMTAWAAFATSGHADVTPLRAGAKVP
jgi:integrase